MSHDLADLYAAEGNSSAAASRRATASAIAAASIGALYVAQTADAGVGGIQKNAGDAGGWFRVLDVATGVTTEVRHVIDTIYTAAGFCGGDGGARSGWGCAFSAVQRAQMAAFARTQLVLPSGAWIRALSLLDAAAPIERPDHGASLAR